MIIATVMFPCTFTLSLNSPPPSPLNSPSPSNLTLNLTPTLTLTLILGVFLTLVLATPVIGLSETAFEVDGWVVKVSGQSKDIFFKKCHP